MQRWIARAAAAALGLVLASGAAMAQAADVIVFAAASLKNVLDAVADDIQRETG